MTTSTATPKITRRRNLAYMGVPVHAWDVLKNGNRMGERVSIIHWLGEATEANGSHPAGTVTARHMRGDGRYPDEFSLYAHVKFSGEDATERATEWAVQQITTGVAESAEAQAHAAEHRSLTLAAREQFQHHQSTPVDCTPPSGC